MLLVRNFFSTPPKPAKHILQCLQSDIRYRKRSEKRDRERTILAKIDPLSITNTCLPACPSFLAGFLGSSVFCCFHLSETRVTEELTLTVGKVSHHRGAKLVRVPVDVLYEWGEVHNPHGNLTPLSPGMRCCASAQESCSLPNILDRGAYVSSCTCLSALCPEDVICRSLNQQVADCQGWYERLS